MPERRLGLHRHVDGLRLCGGVESAVIVLRASRVVSLLSLLLALSPPAGSAQSSGLWGRFSAQAVIAGIHVDPVPGGGSASQLTVVEPLGMLEAGPLRGRLVLHAALDLEGLTMPDGVLGIGDWGEGFDDRRHPHTYVHELMLSGVNLLGSASRPVNLSLSVGKGFVPFGSDDPMNRPALRFPVNHHWSQILERAVTIAGVRAGPVVAEGALFNGDEPERPGQWPRIGGRFGDSWSLRLTVTPVTGVDLEGSRAKVHSPENRPGAATDQDKWHASARLDRGVGAGRLYALGEWARTSEAGGFFRFDSRLAEAEWSAGAHRVYYQFERTERPEEERTLDPFRSLRPHLENSILGTTRWSVHTAGYGVRFTLLEQRIRIEPLLEASYARVADVGGGIFSTESFYGRGDFWSLTAALRLGAGMMRRMGRYGVADAGGAMGMMDRR